MMPARRVVLVVAASAAAAALATGCGRPAAAVEWPSYGGDQGGTKYSPWSPPYTATRPRRPACRSRSRGARPRSPPHQHDTPRSHTAVARGFVAAAAVLCARARFSNTWPPFITKIARHGGDVLQRVAVDGDDVGLKPAAIEPIWSCSRSDSPTPTSPRRSRPSDSVRRPGRARPVPPRCGRARPRPRRCRTRSSACVASAFLNISW